MDSEELFLGLLRSAVHGEAYPGPLEAEEWRGAARLGLAHSVLPLLVEAVYASPEGEAVSRPWREKARRLTLSQACRTAEYLLLNDFLTSRGLRPAVMKGIVLRSLYPQPEQRASADEDLLIRPEEFPAYHQAMLDYGLRPAEPGADPDKSDEVAYEDRARGLYIEVHKTPFFSGSSAYGELNGLFAGCLDRCTTARIYGREIVTLAPTDHLLYMLCHAYKHFLHAGVGIRQVCDIGLFTERFGREIDWTRVLRSCERVRIEVFSAALFAIGAKRLGLPMPEAFGDVKTDESDLLADILSGGLYGVSDINRAHSSAITLDAVAARKQGRKSSGLWRSVFPGAGYLRSRYSYAERHPILTPVAWAHRLVDYLGSRGSTIRPSESLRIGAQRVELLTEYKIIG